MSLNEDAAGEAFYPVPQEENSHEDRTVGFWQEAGSDQNNELLWQDIIEILEREQGIKIPSAPEIDISCNELDQIPLEKTSSEAKIDDGLLFLKEIEQKEINQFQDIEEAFQIQCAKTMNNEQDPILEPSSGENKDLNLKENNGRGKDEIQEVELQTKSSTPFRTGSNGSVKQNKRGKCCECNKMYLEVFKHSSYTHNGELKKCTASLDCKKYFASVQKRIEHEQKEHQERKQFQCQFCHYSTGWKTDLNRHVLTMHSEKKIRCGQQKCGKMFASERDLKKHIRKYHKMVKCPTCGREMSYHGLYDHNRYGRCPGTVAK